MRWPSIRLYWRMALYIGAALIAFVVLSLAGVWYVAAGELENYTATRHGGLGREAARVLVAGGPEALRHWLDTEAPIPPDVTVYVLDAGSRDLRGQPLPALYANFVRRSVIAPPERSDDAFRPVRLAPQLRGPGGEVYTFLVLPNRIGVAGNAMTTLGLLAVAVLVIATVAGLIARSVGRPVGELQRVVRELASGQIDARVPTRIAARGDELGSLAADFNRMAGQLSDLLEGRARLMGELSHELRSPLARLQAALALAAHRGSIGAGEVTRIEAEIQRMDRTLGDLLRFSRLDAAAPLQQRLIRLDELLQALVRDEELEADSRGCRLELAAPGGQPVVGDPDVLRAAFENVLRNALRYAPADSVVAVELRFEPGWWQVTVADRGPGIPPALLERIFDPYVRVPDGSEGTGLGLAIARRALEAHGGTIAARPRDGGGLEVVMRLPAAQIA
ncbi:MAG: HAMP domain-containing sensor histidine kinase [Steroidobacteraceae bacterium]|nr:HAMP domain-containing histidine kinase [Nevskiaceae bacterium]MCP5338868.1 HAMP domain-containing histidine kinase [Nevskiaceae bacterium]MCP5471619.1 HAMP domain-containing histidine kinase [Nevskiaceae bacterium]